MLIFALNRRFQVLEISLESAAITPIVSLEPEPYLQLHQRFEKVWTDLIWPRLSIAVDLEILFVLGPTASFTDSRIVFIWLNSLATFQSGKFRFGKHFETRYEFDQDINQLLVNLPLIRSKIKWSEFLEAEIYTREPSIGKKKTLP